jgi:Ca2+-binding RTX toxin-like protein
MNGGADDDVLNLNDTTPNVDPGVITLNGGDGNDTYVFVGNSPGAVNITESATGGVDTLDFSSFTGGPINLDLSLPTMQALGTVPGNSITLSDGMGIENVIGTSGADIIRGNGADNQLSGAALAPASMGAAPSWNGVTQTVYLDFDSRTDPGEHVYTAAERSAIISRLYADYVGPDPSHPWFHFQFTTTVPSSGDYATVYFNDLPTNLPNNQETGGFSDDLDFRNTRLGGTAYVQVNGILGAPNEPPDTTDNWVALSEKIAAHEVGHLAGLLHEDSFGPIGYGIHFPPGAAAYNPPYPGPVAAYETFNHIMGSPASVGSTRFNDIRDLFFGEREAIKLEFAESGTVINEQSGPHQSVATAQAVPLVPLAVPNTLSSGLNANKQFYVEAVDVTGSIGIDPNTGVSENDFYSFTGKAGDLMSFEVLSKALTRLGSNTIDGMIRIMDTNGNVLAFRGGSAFNDDQFEPTDASLFDFRLPADGTYIVEVDTFSSATTPDTDTGAYELFMYRFKAYNPTDGGDVLDGRGGNDTLQGGFGPDMLIGGAGNDVMDGGAGNDTFAGLPSGNDAAIDSAGRDTLDFSAAALGITLNLGLDAGQIQTLDTAANTLALTGTFEIVFGTNFADNITGNNADNTIYGLAGNDSLSGSGGNDVLVGGDGNDTLLGGDGNDLLIGGTGGDTLQGQAGDDILIGSQTTFDSNQSALDSIMAEWTSADSYAQRVSYLTGTAGGANGTTFLLKGTTVQDDGIRDDLTGGLGADLFFKFGPDTVNDKEKGETVL